MAYVVTQDCIKCKYTDCVEVCPVDCFYEGPDMLVINPDECIDCGVCEPECPVDAIIADNNPLFTKRLLDINDKMSQIWPVIVEQIDPPADADKWNPKLGYDKDKTELLDQFDKD
jgi:ferredoxin|tara:strand:- start:1171 stop:1515 length:345 start_codon:yes stop_codon:yes gene_type:complete